MSQRRNNLISWCSYHLSQAVLSRLPESLVVELTLVSPPEHTRDIPTIIVYYVYYCDTCLRLYKTKVSDKTTSTCLVRESCQKEVLFDKTSRCLLSRPRCRD